MTIILSPTYKYAILAKMPPKKDVTSESGPLNLLRPLLLLSYSAYYIVPTIIDLLLSLHLAAFFSFSEFKEHWFARFWAFFGPRSRDFAAPVVLPLLENSATGVCLDIGKVVASPTTDLPSYQPQHHHHHHYHIFMYVCTDEVYIYILSGPGTGQWLSVFGRANNPTITKIYGVEPNHGMHKLLNEEAAKAGLKDVYEVIGCGAQELSTKGRCVLLNLRRLFDVMIVAITDDECAKRRISTWND